MLWREGECEATRGLLREARFGFLEMCAEWLSRITLIAVSVG
jgi:hypothetical protein